MAASYNELFGLGSHSPDASLEGWWKLQDDAANTTVVDDAGTLDGTLTNAGNTSASTTTGPTSWLPKALSFDGTNDYVALPSGAILDTANPLTLLARFKFSGEATGAHKIFGQASNATFVNLCYLTVENALSDNLVFDIRGTSTTLMRLQSSGNVDDASWHAAAGIRFSSSPFGQLILDGTSQGTSTSNPSGATFDNIAIGRVDRGGTLEYFKGDICDCVSFSRSLTTAEAEEWRVGPEPLNTVAPTLTFGGSTWTGTIGTWDSQSNGTITYAWELRLASDDSVVQSGTGSSPSGSNPADGSYYLWVRGTNDGGFDSAEDSVSTTQVLGGGGGSIIPLIHHHRQLMAA